MMVILGIIFVLALPPSFYSGEDLSVSSSIDDIPDSDDVLIKQTVLGLFQNSVVDTDFIFTESDQSKIQQWLDETNNPLGSKKYGISVNTSLVDANDNISSETNVFGISQLPEILSVTDSDGNPLDLGGSVQVTFDSIASDVNVGVTGWAIVSFYVDDNRIDNKNYYLWTSYQDKKSEKMSVLTNLSFDPQGFPISPSFSDAEKTNFTFDFKDENLSDGNHKFRVVFSEIHSIVDNNNYDWKGQNIIYTLDFIVDGNKITKESEDGNGEKISVFKSDNKITYFKTTQKIGKSINGAFQLFTTLTPIQHHTIDIYVNDELLKTIDSSTNNFELNFPRDSQLRVEVDGEIVYDEKMPLSQVNHFIKLEPGADAIFTRQGSCQSSGGGVVFAYYPIAGVKWSSVISSSFGYSDRISEQGIGADRNISFGGC